MMELWLTPKQMPSIPIEAEVICPDVVAGKTLKEVHELEVYEAFRLDNERRSDMGYPSITFDQFLQCVNHQNCCVSDGMDCKK